MNTIFFGAGLSAQWLLSPIRRCRKRLHAKGKHLATELITRRNVVIGYSLCILVLVLDGFDNQILGLSVPSMMREWNVAPGAFAPVMAITVVMMSIGTAIAGWLGDRAGRRIALAISLVLLGVFTIAASFATGPVSLTAFRAIAALGLGGAMPNAAALLAELSPVHRRSLSVSLGMACIPLGGLAAGLMAPQILANASWRGLFQTGGTLTLLVAAALVFLREPKPENVDSIASADAVLSENKESATLFSQAYRFDTCALWAAFFFCMLAVYAMFNWMPTAVSGAGFGDKVSSLSLAAFNFGGITGSFAIAAVMDRAGSRRPMALMAAAGTICAAVTATLLVSGTSPSLIYAGIGLTGFFIAGLQSGLFALAAQIYPSKIRATGIGGALAFGRLGAIASSLVGNIALGLSPSWFMGLIGASALLSGGFVLLLRRHIPKFSHSSPQRTAPVNAVE